MRALSAVSSRKVEQGGGLPSETIPQHHLKTADIIDLVPDENGVYQVAYNGGSKELTKIATEIAKGEIQSLGAKKLVYMADNIAQAAATTAEQIISTNIAKINDSAIEFYANNINILNEVAKKYPMLSKPEKIELANKQILANASAELLEYSKFLNGGKLPNDARLLGKNAGRMILKSLDAGASAQEVINMLLKAGISGRNSTAAKALLQTGDINAYNAVMRQGERELIAELSNNVRTQAKNESIAQILNSAKEQAIKNDEMLKKGIGNQDLDDITTKFISEKSGKEFEVAENGFGRELMKYEGKEASDDMKRSFSAWEAQGQKADITLNDGRKVVYLSPDEAIELSYGKGYLYGFKSYDELMATKMAESLEQKFERLKTHPAYENLLKMRENTLARELKGEKVGGSRPTVFYEPQSQRYLRTGGGGGIDNPEREIRISKSDVAKLRAGKINTELVLKLEQSLDALNADPAASGVLDHLLTRDFHLGTAQYKKQLVETKTAENSRISSENVANSRILAEKKAIALNKPKIYSVNEVANEVKSLREFYEFAEEYGTAHLKDYKTDKAWEELKDKLAGGKEKRVEIEKQLKIEKELKNVKSKLYSDFGFENSSRGITKDADFDKKTKSDLKKYREQVENKLGITPIKEFGTNYAEFYHDGANAIRKLLAEKQGQVAGAFYKDGLGDIDVVWGNKEIGLNKIIEKHSADFESFGGVEKGLDEIITNGKNINQNGVDTIWYKKGDDYYAIGLSKGYKNKGDNNWIITAYEKKNLSDNQKLRIDRFLNGGDSKTLSAYAEIKSSKTPELTTAENSTPKEIKSQENIKSTGKMPEISAGSKIKNEIFKNFMADEGVVQAAIVNDFGNFKLFAKNKLDDLLVDAYEKSPDETRKLFDNVIGEFEPALNEFHKIAQSGELGAAKKTITQKQDLGKWELDKKALWHFESTLNTSAGGIKKDYTDDLAKIDELNLGDEVKFKLKEKYEKFLSSASDRVKKSKGGNVVFHHKKWGDATELEAFRAKLFNQNSTPKDIKSGGGGGLKKGFSTQAMNQALLNVGSGVAGGNIAMANEDDPNKKAQAFIMGFLAGFGGSAGAMKLLSKNATKLAPQLARASQKLASELPRLFNDRPDILGGVLGRMNNAKDNFKNIFGGEKALGANKAKLEEAQTMLKSGAKDDEIWAKTGWYKDIDNKWKFEINAKGAELKELNAQELDEATKIIKRDYFDKQMNLKELYDFTEFKNGYIDFDEIKRFYVLPKNMSKDEFIEKFPFFRMSVNDYMEHGFYKDIDLLHDEIIPARKILNQEYNKTPLNEVLDDPELFASYPQLKDVKVSVDELKSTEKAHFNPNKNEIVLNSALDAQDMKSSLYHEIQHAVQKIEGFASGGEVGNLNYKKLAGEAEARNVQARLGADGKEYPFKTMDIAPNERIVKFDSDVSASYTPKQKEMRGVYNVAFNEKRATQIYKDIEDVENVIKFEKGRADNISTNKDGFGSLHIQKHLDPKNEGYITTQEYLNMGEYIRKAGDFKESSGKRVYDYTDENGVRFRAIIGDTRGGKDRVISFFSNRKAGSAYDRQNYTRNQPLSENSTTSNIKSQELAMRENFSPKLKASYEMRDKLLKSANQARAKLSQKGKDELDKLKDSKDSKLSRDAQIMQTLENAKSNPARFERLKKLYLDENGKVKDSIGLC